MHYGFSMVRGHSRPYEKGGTLRDALKTAMSLSALRISPELQARMPNRLGENDSKKVLMEKCIFGRNLPSKLKYSSSHHRVLPDTISPNRAAIDKKSEDSCEYGAKRHLILATTTISQPQIKEASLIR